MENDGPDIVATNYWESSLAKNGYVYISSNAGAIRILVPHQIQHQIADMKTAKMLIISRGPHVRLSRDDLFEFMFDDGSNSPFVLNLSPGQMERLPDQSDVGSDFIATIWIHGSDGESKCIFTVPCRYRVVPDLPCLKPWA